MRSLNNVGRPATPVKPRTDHSDDADLVYQAFL